MKRVLGVLLLLVGLTHAVYTADPEIVGNWVGAVDTDRGAMDIGLSISSADGKLQGVLKTAHGDWEITTITGKGDQWTIGFKGGGNEGQLIGRLSGTKFAGDWKSKLANGTFELVRAKKKG
jgi:opacity protein-like surface antigen